MAFQVDEAWVRKYCADHGVKNPLAGAEPPKAPKRTKYGNKKAQVDGITFDSQHEAARYLELKLLRDAGEIVGFWCQQPFMLPGGVKYIADFVVLHRDGTYTVEDAKSDATRKDKVYRLKKRQMRACLGIEISEV